LPDYSLDLECSHGVLSPLHQHPPHLKGPSIYSYIAQAYTWMSPQWDLSWPHYLKLCSFFIVPNLSCLSLLKSTYHYLTYLHFIHLPFLDIFLQQISNRDFTTGYIPRDYSKIWHIVETWYIFFTN
jgi:hypothetical protein